MPHVTVVATIIAKPGKEAETEAALRAMIGPTRLDPGYIQYDLHRDLSDPRVFLFYEIWESRAQLDQHLASPHLAVFKAQVPELVESTAIRFMERINAP
ncbi:MAG: putative quinol monooxygenase [Rhodospirillaceae bacterium]